jgi:hypothetical protein
MIKIKTDTHTHTLASGHAYSTIEENLRAGKEQGLELVGITDHFSSFFVPSTDFACFGFFINKKALPEVWHGVRLLFGAEVDIIDLKGNLFGHDLYIPYPNKNGVKLTYEEGILNRLDYLIASVHYKDFAANSTVVENTELYIKALEHENVKILGHIGRSGLEFDIDEVVKAAKSLNKMIEINEASFGHGETVRERCLKVALACAKYGTKIAVNSDAHSSFEIGKYPNTEHFLDEIDFPVELIGNRDAETFLSMIGI